MTITKEEESLDISQYRTPGFLRRLAALLYDGLLLVGLLFLAMLLIILPLGMIQGWEQLDTTGLRSNPFYIAYLLSIPLLFFIGFWSRGGQTLGMRTWRIKLIKDDGTEPGLVDGVRRSLTALLSWAPLGLGFLWILVDSEGLAWHDRLSHTRLVVVEKKRS